MKLAAIYNVWDGVEMLRRSIDCLVKEVDIFIIVYQEQSNFGEIYNPLPDMNLEGINCILIKYNPPCFAGFQNEIAKRNIGLDKARELGCSHFLHIDTDEMYKDFSEAKQLFIKSGAKGSVCKLYTYFRWPTLRFETEDGYFVPFIHELSLETRAGISKYPYYVDPTRKINCENVVLLDIFMHHFSWVRIDILRKIRNSSAKANLERGTMLNSYHDSGVKEGFYVKDYDKKLKEVDDFFNLNPIFK